MNFEEETFSCDKHGEVKFNRRYSLQNEALNEPYCPVCFEEKMQRNREEEAERQRIELEKQRAQRLLIELEAPARYENADFNNYKTNTAGQIAALKACKAYAKNFKESSKLGGGLLFVGGVGTGKTHLAISIGKELIKNKCSARYTNVAKVIRSVRASWNTKDYDESDVYWDLIKPELLILDEIGVQAGTDNERNILFNVINGRYERCKPTILVSNLPEPEMIALIGERAIDRIKEGRAGTIVFNWQSYRQKAA
jgi:DNA replication protein DnaC